MCDENHCDPTQRSIEFYLEHYDDKEIMFELWLYDPIFYLRVKDAYPHWKRVKYIKLCKNHEPIYNCPECGAEITTDEWGEEYCSICGLITRTHYNYVAGLQFEVPFGIK